MDWLNYHHLFYFWRIAREGSLSRAAEHLHVTHSTLSAQLRALETALGGELFERRGRSLVLTAKGDEVASYADEIFRLGAELYESARAGDLQRRVSLRVGVVSDIPKTLAYRLLLPALDTPRFRPLFVRQASLDRLLDELSAGRLHMILSDIPPPEAGAHRVFAHLLGSSGILIYGARALARSHLRGRFPGSLDGAPMLLPAHPSSLRRQVDRWLVEHDLHVSIEGEFNDAGLMRTTGLHGHGFFLVREALKAEVEESRSVVRVGRLKGVEEKYYVVSTERRVRHDAVSAIVEHGRIALRKGGER